MSDHIVFDENALGKEIARVWGRHGAHSEVYGMLRARIAELEAQTPSALKAKLESAERRIAELEARPRGIGDGDIRHALDERDRYREALDKIAFQTRDYAPTLECCQRIAREALNP